MVVMLPAPVDAVPPGLYVPTADERIVMRMPWDMFETLLAAKGDDRRPKVTYLNGVVELMSPSTHHERINVRFAAVVEEFLLHLGIPYDSLGAWTLTDRAAKVALEPDSCFTLGPARREDRPDLAVEVVWTSGGLNKLDVYRRLGVPEVWIWIDGVVEIHVLTDDRYERREASPSVPGIDLGLVTEMLALETMSDVRRELRRRLAT